MELRSLLEKVLTLQPHSLTKEVKLTQDLTSLLIDLQIPPDLLCGANVEEVKANVRSLMNDIEWQKYLQRKEAFERIAEPPQDDVMERLKMLKMLFEEGLLEEEEYRQRKGMLINSLLGSSQFEGAKASEIRCLFAESDLHRACVSGQKEMVQKLVESGMNVNAKDEKGRTCLHLAVIMRYADLAKYLVYNRADPHIKDDSGKSAMDYAHPWLQGEMKEILNQRCRAEAVTGGLVLLSANTTYGMQPQSLNMKAGTGMTPAEDMMRAAAAAEPAPVRTYKNRKAEKAVASVAREAFTTASAKPKFEAAREQIEKLKQRKVKQSSEGRESISRESISRESISRESISRESISRSITLIDDGRKPFAALELSDVEEKEEISKREKKNVSPKYEFKSHQDWLSEKQRLERLRASLEKERTEIEKLEKAVVKLERCSQKRSTQGISYEFSKVPGSLEDALKDISSVRTGKFKVSRDWKRRRKPSLLLPPVQKVLSKTDQKNEKSDCFDLLEALTRCGELEIENAELHVVTASCYCFEKSVLDTLILDNVNPIEETDGMLESIMQVIYKDSFLC